MFSRGSRWSMAISLCALLLAPLGTVYVTQAIWMESLWAPLPWMAGHWAAVGLFWVLFSCVSFTLYGFLRRLVAACLPPALVCLVLAVVSRFKMDINGAPLTLGDFAFVGDLGQIVGLASTQLLPSLSMVLAGVLVLVSFVALARLEGWSPSGTQGFILGGLAMVCLISACYPGALQNTAMALDEGCVEQEERSQQVGVVLGLYSAWAHRLQSESGTADPAVTALAKDCLSDAAGPGTPAGEEAPDIIFITSESFFDVTRLPDLTFAKDPLPNFHRLSRRSTNGLFLSNTYGGGTGHVEMEFFTAVAAGFLREGDSLSTLKPSVYQDLPAFPRLLTKAGYATQAVHAHTSELYNRAETYPALGFETMDFREDFITPTETAGGYVSDASFAQELIARYEARDKDKPLFLYGLSMENHQTYPPDKYPQPSGYPARSDKLSEGDLAILDALVTGLHHADESLGTLVDYFSQVDRPVMLVFLGDHLPSLILEDESTIYTRLGWTPSDEAVDWSPEEMALRFSTDYLVWTNYEDTPAPDHTESCTLLSLHLLDRAGIPKNRYFSWLEETIAPKMLLTRGKLFVDPQGTPSYDVPPDFQATLDTYTALARNMIYNR